LQPETVSRKLTKARPGTRWIWTDTERWKAPPPMAAAFLRKAGKGVHTSLKKVSLHKDRQSMDGNADVSGH